MKKLVLNIVALAALTTSFVSCTGGSSTGGYYEPDWHYNCYAVYDDWGWYLYDECVWEYYNNGELVSELDMQGTAAEIEANKLNKMAAHYAERFELSSADALKVAKNVNDFAALEDRSEQDMLDFAKNLYGVNPTELVSALGKAQVGQNAELDALVDSAAKNFNISNDNTRALIKEISGSKTLEENGINL